MINSLAVYLLLLACLVLSHSFAPSVHGTGAKRQAHRLPQAPSRLYAEAPPAPADDPYLVHVCVSCEYEYDEKKGFKKRLPPGTRMRDQKTFLCPVCGAAIDQFEVKGPSP